MKSHSKVGLTLPYVYHGSTIKYPSLHLGIKCVKLYLVIRLDVDFTPVFTKMYVFYVLWCFGIIWVKM